PYGVVLERGELALRFERELGSFAVFYHEHRMPLDPKTYPRVIDRAAGGNELAAIRDGLLGLPDRHDPTPEQVEVRDAAKEELKRRLAAVCSEEPRVAEAIETAVAGFNGTAEDGASFDALHELLEAQAFRLASWRVAPDEINYRRFFDVNDLA